ncbi:MAG: hypothetical protein HZB53_12910 [Chloroflexi bacterium]|nr:hypothetical protein [Chloroflexota bacterium]
MNVELVAAIAPIHRQLAISGILYMGAAGLIGITMWVRRKPQDANYRGILSIGWVLGLVIGALGLIMLLAGANPRDPIHILYGIVTAISVPGMGAWQIQRGHSDLVKPRFYAITALFVMGVMIRGMMTAS